MGLGCSLWVWELLGLWALRGRWGPQGCTRGFFSLRRPFKLLPLLFRSLEAMETPCLLGAFS